MKSLTTAISLPAIFLRDELLLPGADAILFVGRRKSVAAIDAALAAGSPIFLPLQKDPSKDTPKPIDVYRIGVICEIADTKKLPDGTVKLTVRATTTARLVACKQAGRRYWRAQVRPITPQRETKAVIDRTTSRLFELLDAHQVAFNDACVELTVRAANISKDEAIKALNSYRSDSFWILPSKSPRDTRPPVPADIIFRDVKAATRWKQSNKEKATRRVVRSHHITVKVPLDVAPLARFYGSSLPPSADDLLDTRKKRHPHHDAVAAALVRLASGNLYFRAPPRVEDAQTLELPKLIRAIASTQKFRTQERQALVLKNSVLPIAELVIDRLSTDIHRIARVLSDDSDLPQVFVSHADADKDKIKPILLGLLSAGLRLFIDKPDRVGLETHLRVRGISSAPFRREISTALRESSCVLCLWSLKSTMKPSTELLEEASFGKARGSLVQASIDDPALVYEGLPFGFKEWQLFDISKELRGHEGNHPVDVSLLVREIKDVIRRNPRTHAPLGAWRQASTAVNMAVVHQQLRTLPKPPPPAPPATYASLEELQKTFLTHARMLAERLAFSNHFMERDIAAIVRDVITAFSRPLDAIDLAVAPSIGELLIVMRDAYKDPEIRKEVAAHVIPALHVIASSYENFISRWGAWADQRDDPGRDWITPENADRTREAADIVIEFARDANVVHRSVPDVLVALRQLIKPALSFSRFNEYRYLNALGEGLRACWNEGERYINDQWPEIQRAVASGSAPNVGPFNDFILEMAEALLQLSRANPELFGWLFVRVGYLQRLKAGDLLHASKGSSD